MPSLNIKKILSTLLTPKKEETQPAGPEKPGDYKLLPSIDASKNLAANSASSNPPGIQIKTPEPVASSRTFRGEQLEEEPPAARANPYPNEKRDTTDPDPITWTQDEQIQHLQNLKDNPEYRNNPENKVNRGVAAAGMALKYIAESMRQGASVKQALAGGLGAGIGGAIVPKTFADVQHQSEIDRLQTQRNEDFKRSKQLAELSGINLENQVKATNIQGKLLDNKGQVIKNEQAALDYLRTKYKPLYDSLTATGQLTEEGAKVLRAAGYPVTAYDAREFDRERTGGVLFETPKKGKGAPVPVLGAPIDKAKTYKEYTSPSGEKYTVSQEKAAEFDNAIAVGDATRAMQTLIANNKTENDNIEDQNKVKSDKEKAFSDRDGWMTLYNLSSQQAQDLQVELQTLKASQTPDPEAIRQKEAQVNGALKTRDEALAKANESESLANRRENPTPRKTIDHPVQLRVPKLVNKGGKNNAAGSESDYQKALQRIKKSK